jgi:geranylgeranyl diphosphate synthase type I
MVAALSSGGFGPLAEIARQHLASGGKQFRARLVLGAAAALDLPASEAVPFAAACELLHNASLVHDDLQDGDTVRRGRPAVWAEHGMAQAVNAGDLLLMLPTLALDGEAYAPELRWALARSLARRAARTACGQALELEMARSTRWAWADYVQAAAGKTGQLFALPIEGAALIAGFDAGLAEALGDAAVPLGVLFQIRDDILDLYGDKGRGARGNDIREGKVSALVLAHLARRPEEADAVLETLRKSREETADTEVSALAARMIGSGALAALIEQAEGYRVRIADTAVLARVPRLASVVNRMAEQLMEPLCAISARCRAEEGETCTL